MGIFGVGKIAMQMMSVNFAAVVVAAVASMVLGFLWFGPLFGKKWMELSGHKMGDMESKKGSMGTSYLAMFVGYLVSAYVLANIVKFSGAASLVEGAITGFMVWLGFVATVTLGMVLWDGKPVQLYLLTNAYQVINFALMGAILFAMG